MTGNSARCREARAWADLFNHIKVMLYVLQKFSGDYSIVIIVCKSSVLNTSATRKPNSGQIVLAHSIWDAKVKSR